LALAVEALAGLALAVEALAGLVLPAGVMSAESRLTMMLGGRCVAVGRCAADADAALCCCESSATELVVDEKRGGSAVVAFLSEKTMGRAVDGVMSIAIVKMIAP
jgi:hypothetical protein